MTRNEWLDINSWMQINWPRVTFDVAVVKKQHELVEHVSYGHALAAVKAVGAEDWPPSPLAIARIAGELAAPPEPDFDEVRAAFRRMLRHGFDVARCPKPRDWDANDEHPRIADYFDRGRWLLWCNTPESDTTFVAQQRDEYRAGRSRFEKAQRLLAAGVDRAQLERPANGEPRKLTLPAAVTPLRELPSDS